VYLKNAILKQIKTLGIFLYHGLSVSHLYQFLKENQEAMAQFLDAEVEEVVLDSKVAVEEDVVLFNNETTIFNLNFQPLFKF
jgi:hypothetical protein